MRYIGKPLSWYFLPPVGGCLIVISPLPVGAAHVSVGNGCSCGTTLSLDCGCGRFLKALQTPSSLRLLKWKRPCISGRCHGLQIDT
jgi:hypothetical protein